MSSKLAPKHKERLRRLVTDYPYFARNMMKIKDKTGKSIPFLFNEGQHIIHSKVEAQLASDGWVRAIILKPRQIGTSTYTEGRFYHKTGYQKGKSAFILTHEDRATSNLFNMAKRFHNSVPESLRPKTAKSNAKELVFEELDGGYRVGTAGSGNVARSDTIQYFHGSEVAMWKNTDEIMTGALETVPDMRDTEIILESTAKGIGNMFHTECMKALRGESEYILIFIPWFIIEEYEDKNVDIEPTEEEEEIISLFFPELPRERQLGKISWRRRKIIKLGRLWKFRQEYPSTVDEAFQTSGDSLIRAEDILRARGCKRKDKNAPLIMGVDPARDGGDRSVIMFRQGREVPHYYKFDDMDQMRLAGILAKLIDQHKPAAVNIDVAHGYGTIDRLNEMGYSGVNGIHFSRKAIESDIYRNVRAEMWCNMREWFMKDDINIPDKDELHADLTSVPDIKHTSDGTIRLVSKEKIKEEYKRSPDLGDALALTFAVPVSRKDFKQKPKVVSSGAKWKRR